MPELTPFVGGRKITGPDVTSVVVKLTIGEAYIPPVEFNSVAEAGSYVNKLIASNKGGEGRVTLEYRTSETTYF